VCRGTVVPLLPPSQVILVIALVSARLRLDRCRCRDVKSAPGPACRAMVIFTAGLLISPTETGRASSACPIDGIRPGIRTSEDRGLRIRRKRVSAGDSSVEPLMMGFAPLPYAPNVMGEPLLPLDGAVSELPYQTSPR